jgi:hypothetical protein
LTDSLKLVVGLGVGIPVFFIAALVLAIVYISYRRHARQYAEFSSDEDDLER